MANWDDVAMYEEIATNAYGTATEKMNAYTDSVQAAQTRLTTAVEEWALKLNQSDAIKFFYDKLAFVIKNLDALAVSLLAITAITKSSSLISSIGNILGKVGMRVANFGNAYSTTSKGNLGNPFKNAMQNAKDTMAQKELITQQKLYAEALKTNIAGLNEMQQNNATILQNQLLQMSAKDKEYMATMLLADAETAQATSSVGLLSAEGQRILIDTLLSQSEGLLDEEEKKKLMAVRNSITATNNTISAEEDLAVVTDALAKARQNGLLSNSSNTSTVIGGNLRQAANRPSWGKNIATGAASMVGMLGGGFVGQKAAEYGGLGGTGQTANMMALGLGGQVFGKGLVGLVTGGGSGLLSSLGVSAGATGAALALPIVGWIAAGVGVLGAAIYAGIKAHQKAVYDAANKKYEEAVEQYNTMNQSRSNVARYQELAKGVSNLGNNISLSDEEYQEFLDIGNELAELYPTLISHTDAWGNSMLLTAGKAGTLADEVKELLREQQHIADSARISDDKFGTDYKEIKKKYDKAQEDKDKAETEWSNIANAPIVGADTIYRSQMSNRRKSYEDKGWSNGININNLTSAQRKELKEALGENYINTYSNGNTLDSFFIVKDVEEAQKALATVSKKYESTTKEYNRTLSSITKEFNETVQAIYRELQYDPNGDNEYADIINDFTDNQNSFMQELINTISPDLDKDEAKAKIQEMLKDYADLIKDEANDISNYYDVIENATNNKELSDARAQLLLPILHQLFGTDGYDEKELEIMLKFNFEFLRVEDGKIIFKDLEDAVNKYREALNLADDEFGKLANDFIYGLTEQQLNQVLDLINQGYINKNTSQEIVSQLLSVMQEHDSRLDLTNFLSSYSKAWNQDLINQLRDFFMEHKDELENIQLADVVNNFGGSGLTLTMLQAILQACKDISAEGEVTAEVIDEILNNLGEKHQEEIQHMIDSLNELNTMEFFPEADIEGSIDNFKELKSAIDAVTASYSDFAAAKAEQHDAGHISMDTAMDLVNTNPYYAWGMTVDADGIKLNADAMDIFNQQRKNLIAINAEQTIKKEAEAMDFYIDKIQKLRDVQNSYKNSGQTSGTIGSPFSMNLNPNDPSDMTTFSSLEQVQGGISYLQQQNSLLESQISIWEYIKAHIDEVGMSTEQLMDKYYNAAQVAQQAATLMNSEKGINGEPVAVRSGKDLRTGERRFRRSDILDYITGSVENGGALDVDGLQDSLGDFSWMADAIHDGIDGMIKQAKADGKDLVDQFGNICDDIAEEMYDSLGDGFEDAMEHSMKQVEKLAKKQDLDKYFGNLDLGESVDSLQELKAVLEDVASDFDTLKAAMTEQGEAGQLSLSTIMELITANESWIGYLEQGVNGIRLKNDALNDEMTAEQQVVQAVLLDMQSQTLLQAKELQAAIMADSESDAMYDLSDAAVNVVPGLDWASTAALNGAYASLAHAWALEAEAQGLKDVDEHTPNPGVVEGYEGKSVAWQALVGTANVQSSGSGGTGSREDRKFSQEAAINNLAGLMGDEWTKDSFESGVDYDADSGLFTLNGEPLIIADGFDLSDPDVFNSWLNGGDRYNDYFGNKQPGDDIGGKYGLLGALADPKNGYLDDLTHGKYKPSSGGGGGGGGSGDEDDYEPMDLLERLKDLLEAMNKEFYEMLSYAKEGKEGLHDIKLGLQDMDDTYYELRGKLLQAAVTRAYSNMMATGLTLDTALQSPSTEEGDEAFKDFVEAYEDYQELSVELANLDDERVQDYIDILEAQGASNDLLTDAYRELLKTADTVKEYYEYQQKIVDSLKEEYELRQDINNFKKDFALTMAEYYKYTESGDRSARKAYEYIEEINTRGMQNAEYGTIRDMINEFRRQWWEAHDSDDPDRQQRMDRAHEMAEKLRARVGYSGGDDGSEFHNLWGNNYDEYMNDALQAVQDALFAAQTRLGTVFNDIYFQRYNELISQTDENGNYKYSEEEARRIANEYAKGAEEVREIMDEIVEDFQSLGEIRVEITQNASDLLDAKLDTYTLSMPEQWSSMAGISSYYSGQMTIFNEQLSAINELLSDTSMLTDEQILEWAQAYNEVAKAIREAQIEELEAKKDYQDSIYEAAVNEVERYITDLEREQEVADKIYDDEIDKLNDKADAIDRTNQLLELQMALENAQNEKQRVKYMP